MHHAHRKTALVGTALATLALTFSSIGVAADSHETGLADLDAAMAEDQPLTGTKVSIQTQWRIPGEGENFEAAFKGFEDATGIDVVPDIIGTSHETVLRSRVLGNAAPDMAILGQPAAINTYGAEGSLVPIQSFMDVDALAADYGATLGLYTVGDDTWAIPYKIDVKGVIWYPIKAFENAGYAVPQTWDELIALSDQIVADGSAPWCIGMEVGTATGWQATDHIEWALLHTAGPEVYDQWVSWELPFNSPEVKEALDLYAQIYFTDGYVLGGNTAIIALEQTTPMDPMFNEDTLNPGCWMHNIPLWYGPDFFPDQRANPGSTSQYVVGEDIGVFALPPIDAAQNPTLGSGDEILVFADENGDTRPEVKAFAQYLSTPAGIEEWVKIGSAISANTSVPAEWYEGAYESGVAADLLANATDFRFDGSDLMAPHVGSGSFWTEMVTWIADNGANTEDRLQAIDDSK